MDPIDAPIPEEELIAIYTRTLRDEVQVRLDFLDLPAQLKSDLYLEIDHTPGGNRTDQSGSNNPAWDTLVVIPAQGEIKVLQPEHPSGIGWISRPGAEARVLRNPQNDFIEISLNRSSLGQFSPDALVQASMIDPETGTILDIIQPVTWNHSAVERLSILFAFSNSFPAYTPSQALRRWDGAHTGPMGGRHGLYNLLRTSRSHQIPIVLLDLLSPESLSALEYQGGLSLVREMQAERLLSLASPLPASPEPLPEWVKARFFEDNQRTATLFDLPVSNFRFQPQIHTPQLDSSEESTFPDQPGKDDFKTSQLTINDGFPTFTLPDFTGPPQFLQATSEGPDQWWRKNLVGLAWLLNNSQTYSRQPVLLLGGSLPKSPWGNPENSRATFRYLKAHPWIRVATETDLQAGTPLLYFPANDSSEWKVASVSKRLLDALENSPNNVLGKAAWDAYRASFLPVFPSPPDISRLRQNYLGEIELLITAAEWADDLKPSSSCLKDLDQDGSPECMLATQTVWAAFELDSGNLRNLFYSCNGTTIHQAVGSSSQLVSGLGDRLDWVEISGRFVDPTVIPGALSGPQGPYHYELKEDRLVLTSPDGKVTKLYELTPNGVKIEQHSQFPAKLPEEMLFPLILDPWTRFQPATVSREGGLLSYASESQNGRLSWKIRDGTRVSLNISGEYSFRTFLSSQSLRMGPENPNFEYPPGHYDPFPLALIELYPTNNLYINLKFDCSPTKQ